MTWTLGIINVDIVDQTVSPNAKVTAPNTLHGQVGAQQSLIAQTDPSGAAAYMLNYSWSIPYNADTQLSAYVGTYSQSASNASITSVTTTTNPLQFFPIAPFSGGNIAFTAGWQNAGTAFHAVANYQIDAPTVDVPTSTGTVNIGNILSSFFPILTPGSSDQSQPSGISWTANFTSPSSYVHGTVGMTQLAGVNRWSFPSPAPGQTPPPSVLQSTNGYGLDSAPQFGQQSHSAATLPDQVPLGPGGTAQWASFDDPFMALKGCMDNAQAEDYFQDYFTFTPTAKANFGAIPVTVGYMSWSWAAYAQRPDGQSSNTSDDWGQPGVWNQPSATALQSSTLLPTWTENAQDTLSSGPPQC